MTRRLLTAITLFALLSPAALAHRIDEYLQATLLSLEPDRVHASVRLIPGVLTSPAIIESIDTNHDGTFSDVEQHAYAQRLLADLAISIDGKRLQPALLSWTVPQPAQLRDGLGEIHVEYAVALPPGDQHRTFTLENHHVPVKSVYLVNVVAPEDGKTLILAQKRNEQQSTYQLDFERTGPVPPSVLPARWPSLRTGQTYPQLASLFHLGMRHIAEGTDHLLFLLVLLLPAPLLVCPDHRPGRSQARWEGPTTVRASVLHIVGIVTAFTIGHSITLTLAALGFVHIPGRPVEILIAVSILVSAIHALRPIFPGRETWIAGFFGLVHGLAFAATLARLGLTGWQRVAGIGAFNLGIEAMQILVVAAVLPSLLLLSRSRAYPVLRIAGGLFAALASLGWIAERLLNRSGPVDAVVDAIGQHAPSAALFLLVVSFACRYLLPATAVLSEPEALPASAKGVTSAFPA